MSKELRILIVDDDHRMAKTLVDILQFKGYEAKAAHSGFEALEMMKKSRFDCVLTDIKMPEMDGVELYKAIKGVQPDIPVVLMTAYTSDIRIEEGLKEGALASLTKPLDIELLLRFFSALHKKRSIAIVDDDPQFCKMLGDLLRENNFAVTAVTEYHEIIEVLKQEDPVVLLNMKLKAISSLELLREMKEQSPHLPVVLMGSSQEEIAATVEAAEEIGTDACLYKPFKIEELLRILNEIRGNELRITLTHPEGNKEVK